LIKEYGRAIKHGQTQEEGEIDTDAFGRKGLTGREKKSNAPWSGMAGCWIIIKTSAVVHDLGGNRDGAWARHIDIGA
jgi:hypothetical protein